MSAPESKSKAGEDTDTSTIPKHLKWWDEHNIWSDPHHHQVFANWVGNASEDSRVLFFNLLNRIISVGDQRRATTSLLEIGPGHFCDYKTIQEKFPCIDYYCMDVTKCVTDYALKELKIKDNHVYHISISDKKIADNSALSSQFDIVYMRHVLEHQSDIEQSLKNILYLARRKIFITFFIPPSTLIQDDHIVFDDKNILYHNQYSLQALVRRLQSHPKYIRHYHHLLNRDSILEIDLIDSKTLNLQ